MDTPSKVSPRRETMRIAGKYLRPGFSPVTETHVFGRSRRAISASSSRATPAPDNEVSGINARLSRRGS